MSKETETMDERLERLRSETPPPPNGILDTERVVGFRRIGDNVSLWLVDTRTSGVRRIEVSANRVGTNALALMGAALGAVELAE